jgi:hypothetical protein
MAKAKLARRGIKARAVTCNQALKMVVYPRTPVADQGQISEVANREIPNYRKADLATRLNVMLPVRSSPQKHSPSADVNRQAATSVRSFAR